MNPILLAACIIPPMLLSINHPGEYTICPGTYSTHISIQSDNVTLNCLGTRMIGDGAFETGVWSQGIQICNGARTFENITIQGCRIENSVIGISGTEVEDEGMHSALPSRGKLVLKNNVFKTNYSVFTCSLSPGSVILERNKGGPAIILGNGTVNSQKDALHVYMYDITGYNNPQCRY